MNNSYAPTNELQYPEMYASYSPQYQENYIPLNVVPEHYTSPDYVAIDMSMPPPPSYHDATNDIHSDCKRNEEILAKKYKKGIEIIKRTHQQEIETIQRNTRGSFFGGMLFSGLMTCLGLFTYWLVTT